MSEVSKDRNHEEKTGRTKLVETKRFENGKNKAINKEIKKNLEDDNNEDEKDVQNTTERPK